MTVAAPPRPPQVSTSAGHDPGEALIKEAKQRARRRRWIYGAAATVVAIAAVAGFTIPTSSTPPPNDATPHVPAPPAVPLGAPLVQGPDAASTLLTSYGHIYIGYVFVYADGRVLFERDFLGASMPKGVTQYGTYERHLSPRGLDLVRAGKLDPENVFLPNVHSRKKLWGEPTARVWEPSKYAVLLPWSGLDQLPPAAQDILRGTQRTYDPSIGTATWSQPPEPPREGFEVTAAEASTLRQILGPQRPGGYGWPVEVEGRLEVLNMVELFPHGQYVIWGG